MNFTDFFCVKYTGLIMNLFNVLNIQMPDGGPLYAETNLNNIIAEPWNALSSLAFLIPVIYWSIRLKGKYKKYPFLSLCLPLLFLGGIGSTLFHAFRTSRYLLYMDVLPIVLLTLIVSIYFWYKILSKTWMALLIVTLFVVLQFLLPKEYLNLRGHHAVNVSYFIRGFMIFLPALIMLMRSRFFGLKYLLAACLLFIISLLFRFLDTSHPSLLPMGTHWLWHVTGAAGSWLLGNYLYITNNVSFKKSFQTA